MIVAALFGTGYINGAYRVAQTGTLVPVNFLVSDSLTAFIPLYKIFFNENREKAHLFFWSMQFLFLFFSSLLTLGAILFVEPWLELIAPGLDPATRKLSRDMLIVMSFGIPLYLSSALINYVEMAHDDFFPMSVRPSVQNVGMLIGAVISYYLKNPIYLAWGFTASYIYFFLWVLIRGLKKNLLDFPKHIDRDILISVIRYFWKTLRPLILLPIMSQGNIAVERAVATLVSITAISALDYAKFITETLILVVSTPVALAGLATWGGMSELEIKKRLINGVNLLLIFALPFSVFSYMHSESIVSVLFERGKFDQSSIIATSNILQGMSFGLWANVIGYVLIKALNAKLKNSAVMIIMAISLAGNVCFNLIFHTYYSEATLGYGYSIYGCLMFICSIYVLDIYRETSKTFIIVILGCVLYLFISDFSFFIFNNLVSLFLNGVIFLLFWSLYALLFPQLRGSLYPLIKRKAKHDQKIKV
ncbi:virulence factor MviN (plasmid) [Pantoea cypripedii]|uniref:Virulence factor MviN n=2 Tax=Pantoea cypripedii TaxID=55209 RepID=A0A6B9G6E6_PANCY|nr:virulence factor MviN [Pantoea cypripedii]